MSLYIVATPIGCEQDLSERARVILSEADLIIGEEPKEARRLLKQLNLLQKPCEFLNEHSRKDDLQELVEHCKNKKVALISDCGTPGFCDPGSDLVKMCRQQKIAVHPIPGASSLMAFLSVCGEKLEQFWFRGFLPRDREERKQAIKEVLNSSIPVVVMDTPYRIQALAKDFFSADPLRKMVWGLDLTSPQEKLISGTMQDCLSQLPEEAEFLVLIHGQVKIKPRSRHFRK